MCGVWSESAQHTIEPMISKKNLGPFSKVDVLEAFYMNFVFFILVNRCRIQTPLKALPIFRA